MLTENRNFRVILKKVKKLIVLNYLRKFKISCNFIMKSGLKSHEDSEDR